MCACMEASLTTFNPELELRRCMICDSFWRRITGGISKQNLDSKRSRFNRSGIVAQWIR
jgi:hypothetical protein